MGTEAMMMRSEHSDCDHGNGPDAYCGAEATCGVCGDAYCAARGGCPECIACDVCGRQVAPGAEFDVVFCTEACADLDYERITNNETEAA